MRIRLQKGKQRELILKAKEDLSWRELGDKIGINGEYLQREVRSEKRTLTKEAYQILCKIAKVHFSRFIQERLPDNWGRSKGGLNSSGSLIKMSLPKKDEKLAEFIGALLGDGNICFYKKGKKTGVYTIKIAGDLNKDKDYHLYLSVLANNLFGLRVKEYLAKGKDARYIYVDSKNLVEFFMGMGLKAGDKIRNQTTIPAWIFTNRKYVSSCVRGLIDTDGSVFRMSNKDPHLIRINFTNHNKRLLEDTRKAFIILGFNPSKIINERQFHISRKEEIKKYLKEVGFSNKKHIDRMNHFYSPIV